jgi:hypothetical protein
MCAVSQVASRPAPGVTTENSPVATLRGGIALGLGVGLGVNLDEGGVQAAAPGPTNATPTLPERTRMSMTHNRSWARADQPLPIGADRRCYAAQRLDREPIHGARLAAGPSVHSGRTR